MQYDQAKLKDFPTDPGVYVMKKKGGAILYIGKAKNLKARVKQYFMSGGDGRWIIPILQEQVVEIDTLVTQTEKDALLLENTLIKKHKPRFNALLKDDKTYSALKINSKHRWPMLSLIRYKGKPKVDGQYFGPYTSAYSARQTLDLLQRLFPMRQCSDAEFARRTRPCILYDMKRCSGPCVGLVSKEQYDQYVDGSIKFLRGRNDEIVKTLYAQMEQAALALEFERAAVLLDTIHSIENTLEKQSVDRPLRGLTGDVLGVFRQGAEVVLSQLMFQDGKLNGFNHHSFNHIAETDVELFESFLLQYYEGATILPEEILLPVELENKSAVEEILGKVKISTPMRGERKALIDMAYRNAEAAFAQKKDEKVLREKTLLELQEKLHLARYPKRIECIDTSHFSGGEPVSALIAFLDGQPDKDRYRRYQLKSIAAGDDYGALKEVLTRRYGKPAEEQDLPDLLLIDGGKGHLNMALKILHELNIISIDVVGVAKEEGRHDRGATREQLFLPNHKDPHFLLAHSPILFLIQRIRDEAHRFAITYQKKRRTKTTIRSELSSIPGIGPVKQKALLRHFGSIKRIREASAEELGAVKGLTNTDISSLLTILKQKFE